MRKTIVIAIVLGLIVASFGSTAAVAKKKKKKPAAPVRIERLVDFEYMCPCTGRLQIGTLDSPLGNFGGGAVPVGSDDLYITITAEDSSGNPVLVNVNQDDGTGANAPTGAICAGAEKGEPLALVPGMEIRLFIATGPCEDGSASVPMGGTLHLTLSNMP